MNVKDIEVVHVLDMIDTLQDNIDDFYSVNSTLIKDVRPDSTKFVLQKARELLMELLDEDDEND